MLSCVYWSHPQVFAFWSISGYFWKSAAWDSLSLEYFCLSQSWWVILNALNEIVEALDTDDSHDSWTHFVLLPTLLPTMWQAGRHECHMKFKWESVNLISAKRPIYHFCWLGSHSRLKSLMPAGVHQILLHCLNGLIAHRKDQIIWQLLNCQLYDIGRHSLLRI